MRTGEVFYWITDKAKGHDSRPKYHIFICEADWKDDNTFLFISSNDYFKDFRITKSDWANMPKEESFVGGSPIFYSDSELRAYAISPMGVLTAKCMKRLALHVQDSEVMERRHISRVVAALYAACK